MSSYPKCLYRFEAKQKSVEHICFAKLPQTPVDFVKYVCKVDLELTLEEVNFYLKFIDNVFDKKRYSHRIFLFPNDKTHQIRIYFKLNSTGFTRVQTLLYLTAFRYPQEFTQIIKNLYKSADLSIGKLFRKFQEIHLDVIAGKIPDKYNSLSGHGLLYMYPHTEAFKNFKLKPLKQFKKEIKTSKSNVQSYFLT